MLVSVVIAFLALVLTSLIELKSYKITQRIQNFLEHESEAAFIERQEQGNIGDQLEEWMLREVQMEDGKTIDNLTALTGRIGYALANSMRFSTMQEKSVESRTVNQYSAKIQNAVKQKMPIGYKMLFKLANELGFDLEDIMEKGELTEFITAAKENRLDLLFANNGNPSQTSVNMKRMP